MSEIRNCKNCLKNYEIRDEDFLFYDKVSSASEGKNFLIPSPSFCPDCRRQRRLAFRNERRLYRRECDLCKHKIISIYSPNNFYKVYCSSCWWSDKWDQLQYGREFDFNKSFFEQFCELIKFAPRPALHVINNENCDYVNQCGYSKGCYLSYNCDYSENCFYCTNVIRSKDCLDLLDAENCELCASGVALENCYKTVNCFNCKNCHDIYFCRDLIGCADCFFCINLRNKKFCFKNEQLTKEEYERRVAEIKLNKFTDYQNCSEEILKFWLKYPHKYAEIVQSENSSGDYLTNCRNSFYCFNSFKDQDVAYCTTLSNCKDTYDFDIGGYDCELCYEMCSSGVQNYHCLFGANYWGSCSEVLYSDIMFKDSFCFGCIALRNKNFCILNKQYSRSEYEQLVPKIIGHMQKEGEWGEFFPISISPFTYNETVAQEYFSLTKDEALNKGYKWKDEEINERPIYTKVDVPEFIGDVSDDIVREILTCESCGKNYKIIPQELKFYREMNLPIPRKCPDCRHKERIALRNPRKLWKRNCMKCGVGIETTYAPAREEIVYCEKCYLESLE